MGKGRLEAFSDGVLAIIITIMVLELKAPETPETLAPLKLWPSFAIYLVSFAMVAITIICSYRPAVSLLGSSGQ